MSQNTTISYQGQTKQHVTVGFVDLPFPTDLWIVHKTTGNRVMMAFGLSGSGSRDLKIDALTTGDYYVVALYGGTEHWRTIVFHVANPSPAPPPP